MTDSFDAESTTDDVLAGRDLRGQRFFVTGVSSGVGAETARALLDHGGDVVGTIRDLARADEARAKISAGERTDAVTDTGSGGGTLTLVELDLASLASVRACADKLLADGRLFNAVIANAGVMALPFGRTADGFEMQFGTNHLGHFVLVNRIAALLAQGGRVISLSSNGHRGADVDLVDPNFAQTAYDPWLAYGRSKTATSLFAVAFDQRHRASRVRACAVMPGTSMTPLLRHLDKHDVDAVFASIDADRAKGGAAPLKLKSVPQMAATSVWAAVVADADKIGGRYLENCQVAQVDDMPGIRDGVMSYAIDPQRAELLWLKSEALVGETFST